MARNPEKLPPGGLVAAGTEEMSTPAHDGRLIYPELLRPGDQQQRHTSHDEIVSTEVLFTPTDCPSKGTARHRRHP